MKNVALSFVAGLVFGLGLIVAGMANPAKILGFLDLRGAWDPSLALVMVGATAFGAVAFAFAGRMKRSLLGLPMRLPNARHLDRRLLGGSVLFGIGWGLAGICPGPAMVLLGYGALKGVVFVAAMLAGMLAFNRLEDRAERPVPHSPEVLREVAGEEGRPAR
ncbi:MAG: YeeE/YedE family protein [Arenicellales bacterium]